MEEKADGRTVEVTIGLADGLGGRGGDEQSQG